MEDTKFQTTLIKRLEALVSLTTEHVKSQAVLIRRFNALISLTLEVASANEAISTTEKVQRMLGLGLAPAEIGEILGKPTNYVTAVMHKKKKKTKKRS